MRRELFMTTEANDRRCMELVIAKTREGIAAGCWPYAACIARDGKPLIVEHNLVLPTNDPTAHGEVVAIRAACRLLGTIDLKGYDIYTNAAPCPMCFTAIYWAGIRRIVYGALPEDSRILGFGDFIIPPEKMARIGDRKSVV